MNQLSFVLCCLVTTLGKTETIQLSSQQQCKQLFRFNALLIKSLTVINSANLLQQGYVSLDWSGSYWTYRKQLNKLSSDFDSNTAQKYMNHLFPTSTTQLEANMNHSHKNRNTAISQLKWTCGRNIWSSCWTKSNHWTIVESKLKTACEKTFFNTLKGSIVASFYFFSTYSEFKMFQDFLIKVESM